MNVVDFFPLTFQEIPPQDNPAFADPVVPCVIVYRTGVYIQVSLISPDDPEESVTHIASFWEHPRALAYAHTIQS